MQVFHLILQILTLFQTKTVIFHTFSDMASKTHTCLSSLLRLERDKKTSLTQNSFPMGGTYLYGLYLREHTLNPPPPPPHTHTHTHTQPQAEA